MSLPEVKYCPGTLAEGYTTYSSLCLRRVFHGRKVSHILPYNAPQKDESDTEKFIENRKRLSISGVQEKMSLVLEKNKLRLNNTGEQGAYILKPIPRDLKKVSQVPANEHLTMQIAEQVYGIKTAANALIFFNNGDPAYITKRFDVAEALPDAIKKIAKEDFATLAGMTSDTAGPDFKYNYSYEQLAEVFKQYVPAYAVEIEKLFRLILFNYLFSNGDAHLKNFALLETPSGDHVLSPAYDLINTRIHVDDHDFALTKGLFKDDFQSAYYRKTGHAGLADFQEFARRIGIKDSRMTKLILPFQEKQTNVAELIDHSFLNADTKRAYLLDYQTRRNRLMQES